MVPWVGLQFVIVVFPDHTYLLYDKFIPKKHQILSMGTDILFKVDRGTDRWMYEYRER